ncbi:hypothetical protein SAMN04489726_4613 [Allokutzneria albata]|uniref:Recombinase domain-containing protein n=1 Tax=Allokutzneria albata TaxID=211114 RepID=A0A1G9Y706_ALLAB|nr:hypothetical protein SAMN04489726_4613 [Allokutzneria albata]
MIADNSGPVNTGERGHVGHHFNDDTNYVGGDQHVHHYYYAATMHKPVGPQPVTADQIAWLRARFVDPAGLTQAQAQLAGESATVLIAGEPGSGRTTAAQMLLCPKRSQHSSLRMIPVAPATDPGRAVLNDVQVEPGDRLLLDLTDVDRELFDRYQRELPGLREAVQRNDGALVVILPAEHRHWLVPQLQPMRVTLAAPDRRKVLIRHLEAAEIVVDRTVLDTGHWQRHLAHASLSTVAVFAQAVIEASQAPDAGSDRARWLTEASGVFEDHTHTVARVFEKQTDGRARALFLATATLERGPLDAVAAAENILLEVLAHPHDETPHLERPGLIARITSLGASLDQELRVRFAPVGYSSTVMTRFWDDYPDLRPQLAHWIRRVACLPQLSEPDRRRLAERFAAQALRTARPHDLIGAAAQWAEQPQQRMRSLAAAVLSGAALDPRFGWVVRRSLYDWARSTTTSTEVASVTIEVCVQALAPNYPDQAITRLLLLTKHRHLEIAEEAHTALVDLAQDTRFFRRLLVKLTDAESLNVRAFLVSANPERLTDDRTRTRPMIADSAIRARLVAGWRKTMTQAPQQVWAATVHLWLQTHAEDPRREALLDVLIDACGGELDLLGRLYGINRDWAQEAVNPSEHALRQRTATQLHNKIDLTLSGNEADDSRVPEEVSP